MEDGSTPDIRTTLRARLKESLVARDKHAAQVLRSTIAAIENAEAQPVAATSPTELVLEAVHSPDVPRRLVTEAEARGIVAAEVAELMAAAEHYHLLGQADAAIAARTQADVLRRILSVGDD